MKNKFVVFNYIVIIISMMIFGEYLINFATYSSSYLIFLIFFIFLALHVFITGLIVNNNKVYKKNIRLYLILYIVLLVSLTIFINRPKFALFDAKFLSMYIEEINLIPFKTIIHFFTDNVNLNIKLYNIVGNLIALMPLSFLLILFDKKYTSYKKQIKILFAVTLGIELLQFLLSAGRLDIDDFILNIGGALLFLTVIKKLNLPDKAYNLFNNDLNITKLTKYILITIISFVIIIIDILFITNLNIDENYVPKTDYLSVVTQNECNTIRKEKVGNYNLYFDCVSLYLTLKDNSKYTFEDAILNKLLDVNDLSNYFQETSKRDEVTIYKNDDLTVFTCNNTNDLFIGNGNKKYSGECNKKI